MATPRPINEDFNQRYDYDYQNGIQTVSTKNVFGTQNAQVAYRKPNVFAANSNLSPTQTSRNTKNASIAYKNNKNLFNNSNHTKKLNNQTTIGKRLPLRNPAKSAKKLSSPRKALAYVRGLTIGLVALSWTGTVWLYIQMPFAILSLIGMGIDAYLRSTWLYELVDGIWTLTNKVLNFLFGIPEVDFLTLFFIGYIIALVVGVTSLFGVAMQYKLSFLHPLDGRGGSAKHALFIASIVGYAIPGLNLFPWVMLYIVVLIIYPK